MAENLIARLKHAWNVFSNRDPTSDYRVVTQESYSYRPDRIRLTRGNERTIVTSLYNRIALDVSSISIRHVKTDDEGRYLEDVSSGLNNCLTLESNLDQTYNAFMQDVVMSMFDEGVVAIVPVDTDDEPDGSFDVLTMRTGKITQWYPQHVRVLVYNEKTGKKQEIMCEKNRVAIIENPLYSIINEPNSTMQRLIRKLSLLDAVDEQSGSGKLDLIIQLPYIVKTEARKKQAEQRRKDIEMQLSESKYGIAYTDGTEHITQLNRPVENNMLKQIEYLTSMLYSQLGITQGVLDGTADEKTMLNYTNGILEKILTAIVTEIKRKFLSEDARNNHETIMYFKDPFKLVPVSELADISDKMTRNAILSSNEIRQIIGIKPSNDPSADELRNKNIAQPAEEAKQQIEEMSEGGENQNG